MDPCHSFNCENIPLACQQVSKKLDILSTVSLAQFLSSDQVSSIKQSLCSEIRELRQNVKLAQDYLKLIKDDLNVCKEKIAVMEKWEEDINRLDAVLPVINKPVKPPPSVAAGACSLSQSESCNARMIDASLSKGEIPLFRYIEETDWASVPSYMKLRLKLEQVNEFIQTLNRELNEKYTLLRKKKSSLKKNELSLRLSYEALVTAETKKLFFVVASDLKQRGVSERHVSSMSTILRHCRRMREMRNGKTILLIVPN